MDYLGQIEDPRRRSNGTRHVLREVLAVAICAMLSNVETFEDIALWGQLKLPWLRRFLVLKHGVPSHDTFGRLFALMDPQQFEAVFRRWVGDIVPALDRQIAIDGKCVRGSATGGAQAIHLVSAFATDMGLALGQEKVAAKSNEIEAIPALLDALYLKGHVVSIDAMGCQRAVAETITHKGGDWLLALKGNQPTLLERVQTAFMDHYGTCPAHEEVLKGHGRHTVVMARTLPAAGIVDAARWAGCRSVGLIESLRVIKGCVGELERRYYISSHDLSAAGLAQAVRAHWSIENQLHWVLDVGLGEDASTVRKNHAPHNLALLRTMVLNVLRTDTTCPPRTGPGKRRKIAAWDDDSRMNILGLTPL